MQIIKRKNHFELNLKLENKLEKLKSDQLNTIIKNLSMLIQNKLKDNFDEDTFYAYASINLTYKNQNYDEEKLTEKLISEPKTYPQIEKLIQTITKFQDENYKPLWKNDENGFLIELAQQIALKNKKYIGTFANLIQTIDCAHEDSFYDFSSELLTKYEFDLEVSKLFVARNLSASGQFPLDETDPDYLKKLKELEKKTPEKFEKFISASLDYILNDPFYFNSEIDVDNIFDLISDDKIRSHKLNKFRLALKKNNCKLCTEIPKGNLIRFRSSKIKTAENIIELFKPEEIIKEIKEYMKLFPNENLHISMYLWFKQKNEKDYYNYAHEVELFLALNKEKYLEPKLIEFAKQILELLKTSKIQIYNLRFENHTINHLGAKQFFANYLFEEFSKNENPEIRDLYYQYLQIIQKNEPTIEIPFLIDYLKETEIKNQNQNLLEIALSKTPLPNNYELNTSMTVSTYAKIKDILKERNYKQYFEKNPEQFEKLFENSVKTILDVVKTQNEINLEKFKLILLITPNSQLKTKYEQIVTRAKKLNKNITPIKVEHKEFMEIPDNERYSRDLFLSEIGSTICHGGKHVLNKSLTSIQTNIHKNSKEFIEYINKNNFTSDELKKIIQEYIEFKTESNNTNYIHNSEYTNDLEDCVLIQKNPFENSTQLLLLVLKQIYLEYPKLFSEFEEEYMKRLIHSNEKSIKLHNLLLTEKIKTEYEKRLHKHKENNIKKSKHGIPGNLLETFNTECLTLSKPLDYYTCFEPLKELADSNNSQAQYLIGKMYSNLNCLNSEKETAIKYFEMASQNNHKLAQFEIAKSYYFSKKLGEKEKYLEILTQLTSNDYKVKNLPIALIELANYYGMKKYATEDKELIFEYNQKIIYYLQQAIEFETPQAYYEMAIFEKYYGDFQMSTYYLDHCSKIQLGPKIPFDNKNNYILKSNFELIKNLQDLINQDSSLEEKYREKIQKYSQQLQDNNFREFFPWLSEQYLSGKYREKNLMKSYIYAKLSSFEFHDEQTALLEKKLSKSEIEKATEDYCTLYLEVYKHSFY